MRTSRLLLSVAVTFALAGCSASMRVSTTDEPAATPAPAADAQRDDVNALLWMQTATEFEALCRQAFATARVQLDAAIEASDTPSRDDRVFGDAEGGDAGPWNALVPADRVRDSGNEPLAIIADVDETLIDNTPEQARRIGTGAAFAVADFDKWAEERRARALPGAVEFADYAEGRGVTFFYVTNRSATSRQATADNLRALGFPVAHDLSNLLTIDEARGFGSDKGTRRRHVDAKYRVVLLLGDNLGDFIDGVRTDPVAREKLVADYGDWWGSRWIVLPNAAYGSWEGAVTKFCRGDAKPDTRECKLGWLEKE